MVPIDFPPQTRADAIASVKRYFEQNLNPIGDLPAGLLLNFVLEEIAEVIYNRAIHDAQARLAQRVADLDGELYVEEFQYWPRQTKKRSRK